MAITQRRVCGAVLLTVFGLSGTATGGSDEFVWGGDKTGGAPYLYDDEAGRLVGFEAELAAYLGQELGLPTRFVNVTWDNLPDALLRKSVDVVINGYEYSPKRQAQTPTSLPYYVYNLRLIAPRPKTGTPAPRVTSWQDLRTANPSGAPPRVGVLRGSAAQEFLRQRFAGSIREESSEDVDAVMRLLEGGQLDACVQDSPTATYYVTQGRLSGLRIVDRPAGYGLYAMLTRPADSALREQLDAALRKGLRSGKLKEIYQKYGLWNGDQQRLDYFYDRPWPPAPDEIAGDDDETQPHGTFPSLTLGMLAGKLAAAAAMTLALACAAMPLAIAIGIAVAVGRCYGPWWVRAPLTAYVEVLRGTPLLLQVFVWFYLVPQLAEASGISWFVWLATQPPFVVGVFALALNYSASEAENYRAGLQAVPAGQMEAALALGMTRGDAVRRVVLPQAMRIVIPPVTNDFIALLKDTSICSMILITELTRVYYDYKFNREIVVGLALTVALVYLFLSYPLSLLARRLESSPSRQA